MGRRGRAIHNGPLSRRLRTKYGMILPGVSPLHRVRWDAATIVQAIGEVALRAEALGFHHVACPDHMVIPESQRPLMGVRWYDSFTTLSFTASVTRRIRLLSSMMTPSWRGPFLIAKSAATLDLLSRGRLIMGITAGQFKPSFQAFRVPFETRASRADEAVSLMRRLWTEDSVTHRGRFYRCDDMVLDPKPVQRPIPLWIAGVSKAATRAAFEKGDGYVPLLAHPQELKEMTAYGFEHAARIGRTRPIEVMGYLGLINPTKERRPRMTPEQVERRADELAGDLAHYRKIAVRNLGLEPIADPGAAMELIEVMRSAGATVCSVRFSQRELPALLEAMNWFKEEVMDKAG